MCSSITRPKRFKRNNSFEVKGGIRGIGTFTHALEISIVKRTEIQGSCKSFYTG
jgi:hypothetical protein